MNSDVIIIQGSHVNNTNFGYRYDIYSFVSNSHVINSQGINSHVNSFMLAIVTLISVTGSL